MWDFKVSQLKNLKGVTSTFLFFHFHFFFFYLGFLVQRLKFIYSRWQPGSPRSQGSLSYIHLT
uniref:Putative ovule protein n=1 Tax=Solanum chacoense TaxID=4108 RepID=A0A0V0GPL9_SOLCH